MLSSSIDFAPRARDREGKAIFSSFSDRIEKLDYQLQAFAQATRKLGSSAGLLYATSKLRGGLHQVEHLFRENAVALLGVERKMEGLKLASTQTYTKSLRGRIRTGLRPQLPAHNDLTRLPKEMISLAEQVQTFVDRLDDISELADETVNVSFLSFSNDLQYQASCLEELHDDIKTIVIKRHINNLSADIDIHLQGMEEALNDIIQVGIPSLYDAQRHISGALQNLSAVAVFFSSVSATAIQFSFNETGSTPADLVNALWIISLILSIASAINSQLAYHWRISMSRSPYKYVPRLFLMWIKRSPLLFLVGSGIAFFTGLCVFTYVSHQSRTVSILTTIFTTMTSSGLVFAGLWFVLEQWVSLRTSGRRRLIEILQTAPKDTRRWLYNWLRDKIVELRDTLTRRSAQNDEELGSAAPSNNNPVGSHSASAPVVNAAHSGPVPLEKSIQAPEPLTGMSSDPSSRSAASPTALPDQSKHGERSSKWRLQWKNAIEQVIAMNRSKKPQRPSFSDTVLECMRRRHEAPSFAQKARCQRLKSALGSLRVTPFWHVYAGTVRQMQFSPDGGFLATCSWDHRLAIIWEIGDTVEFYRELYVADPAGSLVAQVAWSPDKGSDQSRLLVRKYSTIEVWVSGIDSFERRFTIDRAREIQSVTWMPSGNGFLSIEHIGDPGTLLVHLDPGGNVLDKHTLSRIQILDMAIMTGESRVVAVGTLTKSENGLEPILARTEKRLFVYNMRAKTYEHQVPLLQEVRSVSLSMRSNSPTYALVSFEDDSPQLWSVDMTSGKESGEQFARLTRVHSYLIVTPPSFTGQSFFGGSEDSFVCSSSKSGEIYIWDTTSAILLRTLHPNDNDAIPEFACNRKSVPDFMVVSGSVDSTLRIWSSPPVTPSQKVTSHPDSPPLAGLCKFPQSSAGETEAKLGL